MVEGHRQTDDHDVTPVPVVLGQPRPLRIITGGCSWQAFNIGTERSYTPTVKRIPIRSRSIRVPVPNSASPGR